MIEINVDTTIGDAAGVVRADAQTVNKIVASMMMSMADANIDLIIDYPDEYRTKQDIEAVFNNLRYQMLETVDDIVYTLKDALTERIQNTVFSTKVRQMHYDDKGQLSDIVLNIDIKE